jgi:hypothetical protein
VDFDSPITRFDPTAGLNANDFVGRTKVRNTARTRAEKWHEYGYGGGGSHGGH